MDGLNITNNTNTTNLAGGCPKLGKASLPFLITLAMIYFSGLVVCVTAYCTYWLLVVKFKVFKDQKANSTIAYTKSRTYGKIFRGYMRQLKSGDTVPGKILITVTLVCNLTYLALAIHRVLPPNMLEECISIKDPEVIIELLLVIELLLFSLVRLLASSNLMLFWVDAYTIVDLLTLPHIFITIAVGVDYIGLRFLRFLWLTHIITVLQFTRLVRSQNVVDILNLLIYFIVLWLASSGILHVIEAEGDFWRDVSNSSPYSVLTYVYLTMVTMSTVGYGDFSPVTDLGRAFMIIFIIAGLAFFASILPTLAEVITDYYAKTQYAHFDTTRVPKHVIVCGHITAVTAEDFLKDFLHPDRGDNNTHILFLNPERPDTDLKDVIRAYYTRVQYLLGSVLNGRTLEKARIHDSSAVFILANKQTNNPREEDHANLLRVVSIKNAARRIKVIIQVLHSFSKKKVSEIEGWSVGSDIAVCLNELKLGVLAQSCLCPGFSTLIANLFYTSDSRKLPEDDEWKANYIKGASNEIYSGIFSSNFDGKTFHQAASICFNTFNLVLLGLEKIDDTDHSYYLNPSSKNHPQMRINSETMSGYFIAQDQHKVYDVSIYCDCCADNRHVKTSSTETGKRRKSQFNALRRRRSQKWPMDEHSFTLSNLTPAATPKSAVSSSVNIDMSATTIGNLHSSSNDDVTKTSLSEPDSYPSEEKNGIGYSSVKSPEVAESKPVLQQPSVDLSSMCKLSSFDDDDEEDEFEEGGKFQLHTGDPVQLEECILNPDILSVSDMSFKSKAEAIRDHIIVCLFANGSSPLLGLHNFLKPLRSKYLPPESIKPVVIICEREFIEKEWPIIRNIPKVYLVVGSPLLWSNLKAAKVTDCSVCVVLTVLPTTACHDHAINDKEVILCSLSIQKRLKKLNKKALIITDLRLESNVQFLDFGDEDTPDERIYKAQPFACGEAFSASMFDSVTTSAFHEPGTLYLIEDLIHSSGTKTRCQFVPTPICSTHADYTDMTYKDFYNAQVKEGNICLGISRKLSPHSTGLTPVPSKDQNYVITCPDSDLILKKTDVVFMLTE